MSNPFLEPSRISIYKASVFYKVGRLAYRLDFNLSIDGENKVGAIIFDNEDMYRATGFHIPPMDLVDPEEGTAKEIDWLEGPQRFPDDDEVSARSGKKLYVHEKNTCNWIYVR